MRSAIRPAPVISISAWGAVEVLTPDAIAAFVAALKSVTSSVQGNEPESEALRQTLHDSGFFEHLSGITSRSRGKGKIRRESESKRVEADDAAELIDFAEQRLKAMGAETDVQVGLRPRASYNALLETIGNTFDHASRVAGREKWWASVFADEPRGRTCFTMVDRGVGIFQSTTLKQRLKMLRGSPLGDNGDKLRLLLHGRIPSRTGERHRGGDCRRSSMLQRKAGSCTWLWFRTTPTQTSLEDSTAKFEL